MARRVFYSFDFKQDSQRVAKVKNMGVLEGQPVLSSNQWEEVKKGGDAAIKAWIDKNMSGRSCVVVLIGAKTAGRRWVKYEIKKAWEENKGLVGVCIHNLTDLAGHKTPKGANPFAAYNVDGASMSNIVKAYDPGGATSADVYNVIKQKLPGWVEEGIAIRGRYA